MKTEIKQIRETQRKSQNWLYLKSPSGVWVRGTIDFISGHIRIEYQPSIIAEDGGLSVYNLNGELEERLVYGKSMGDISNESWKTACQLPIYMIEELDVFKVKHKIRALEAILDCTLMLIMLGYGDTPQEVLDWFIQPSYGRWVKEEIPYLVRISDLGSSRVEVADISCTIDGLVSFSVAFLSEDVDLSIPWDRFLLTSKIDVRENLYESI